MLNMMRMRLHFRISPLLYTEAQEVDSRLPDPLLSTRDPKVLCASHSKHYSTEHLLSRVGLIHKYCISVSDIHDNIFPRKSLLHRTCFDQYFSCSGMTGRWGLYLMHRMQFVVTSPIFGNRVSTSKVMPTAPPLSKRSVETPWKHRLYMHLFFVSSSNHVASISTCRIEI